MGPSELSIPLYSKWIKPGVIIFGSAMIRLFQKDSGIDIGCIRGEDEVYNNIKEDFLP